MAEADPLVWQLTNLEARIALERAGPERGRYLHGLTQAVLTETIGDCGLEQRLTQSSAWAAGEFESLVNGARSRAERHAAQLALADPPGQAAARPGIARGVHGRARVSRHRAGRIATRTSRRAGQRVRPATRSCSISAFAMRRSAGSSKGGGGGCGAGFCR